jgi:hypothetical protein
MCRQCWAGYGSPEIVNDQVLHAAALIRAVYEDNSVGMPLHVQLDDWGIDGEWYPWRGHKSKVSKECWTAAEELCKLMPRMSLVERASALALCDGYFEIGSEADRGW